MEVNPKLLKNANQVVTLSAVSTNASIATIYTVPAGKEFYLTGFSMGLTKNATCDVASGTLSISVKPAGGVTVPVGFLPFQTLTAESLNANFQLTIPIKLERLGTVTIPAFSFAAGACTRYHTIYGYTIDNVNA
jgi:hypothetical protein